MSPALRFPQRENLQMVDTDQNGSPDGPQQVEMSADDQQQMIKVYLRIRPFSRKELSDNEDQDCVVIDNDQTVTLKAPKGSATLKSSEKGVGTSVHKFTFSQIFGPETTQAELFEATVRNQTSDFLDGSNALIFSYGVTNAGKTFTIQGTPTEPGILPRVMQDTFRCIGGRLYEEMDLKPFLRDGVQHLDPDQVKTEKTAKAAVFASVKDEDDREATQVFSEFCSSFDFVGSPPPAETGDPSESQFSLWVGFFEIYNENVYDLLQPTRKRSSLRVCDDGAGNAYVKDLRWINILTLSEAWKLVQIGNKNRSAAFTRLNQSSSRSHSIFTMKLLKVREGAVQTVSEFSLCDLAGSERSNKARTFGERLKEAGNINNSLLILGKCISALRCSQTSRTRNVYIPFRESKLTKLFQAFFCGKGQASMMVNINQCSSTYDETLHVMKFSALAKQVVQVIPDKLQHLPPCLFGRDGKPLKNIAIDDQLLESFLCEEEEQEEEADMSVFPQDELLNVIEDLKTRLQAERRKNLEQEFKIRKEMGDAMLQQIMQSEELHTRQMENLKESYEEKLETTFEIYKDAFREHAYQCALSSLDENYVPMDQFIAEEEKVEALRRKISELERISTRPVVSATTDRECQTEKSEDAEETENYKCRYQQVHRENSAMERMCEEKQQTIVSLERRLLELKRTLEDTNDAWQRKVDEQKRFLDEIQQQNDQKVEEISSLKDRLSTLPPMCPVKTKTKRGLLANIKEAVVSPRKTKTCRSLKKNAQA